MNKLLNIITWLGLPTRWIGIAIVLMIAVPTLFIIGTLQDVFGPAQKPHDQHVD